MSKKSAFRTWLYRIIKNHFLNSKRKNNSHQIIPWEDYANGLDSINDEKLTDSFNIDKKLLIEEAKLSCMKGMLLCLTPEQRLIYVMGELFEVTDTQASDILDISKTNFRKKLSRVREQLYNFMNKKCGLINKNNPCRCVHKTNGFIKKGYVNPDNLQFQKNIISDIESVSKTRLDIYKNEGMMAYKRLYKAHNYQEPNNHVLLLKKLLNTQVIKDSFELN